MYIHVNDITDLDRGFIFLQMAKACKKKKEGISATDLRLTNHVCAAALMTKYMEQHCPLVS